MSANSTTTTAGTAADAPADRLPAMSSPAYAVPTGSPAARWLRHLGHDSLYLLTGFPIALVAFVVLVVGLSLSAGLLVTFLGLPVAVVTLMVARGFANLERVRLPYVLGRPMAPARYRRSGEGLKGFLGHLIDGQLWLDTLHGIVVFPIAVVTWSLSVAWWASALGATTWPLWSWAVPDGDQDKNLPELLGINSWLGETMFMTGLGLFFLATLPFVLRGMAVLQATLGEQLLCNARIAELRARVDTLTASRAAVVDAEAQGLRRLERDLHDGPQQRLVRLTMDLSAAERRLADEDPNAAAPLVSYALTQAKEALDELRALSRGIAPPILADRGLGAALAAAVARSPIEIDLDVALPEGRRLPASIENTAYFVVAEALANAAKHSQARNGVVSVEQDDDVLWVQVADDGVGGASLAKGHGLAGLADRVAALDGRLAVDSPVGGPTVLTAEIPCGSS